MTASICSSHPPSNSSSKSQKQSGKDPRSESRRTLFFLCGRYEAQPEVKSPILTKTSKTTRRSLIECRRVRKILAAAVLVGIVTGLGIYIFLLQDDSTEPIEGSLTSKRANAPLNFQGKMNGIKLDDGRLTLDTRTVTVKKEKSEGDSLVALKNGNLYFEKDADTYILENNSKRRLNFNVQYGSVAGDFDYPGFNVIYADEDRKAFIRNLKTGEEKRLTNNVLEVVKKDADGNGIEESAEIRLRNGSNFVLQPVQDDHERTDIDGDSYKERIHLKNGKLYMYDRKHGEEPVSDADDYLYHGDDIYITHQGKIYSIEFKQEYRRSGTYVSKPATFNRPVQIVQLITDSQIPKGTSIQAKVITPSRNRTLHLKGSKEGFKLDISADLARVKFRMESSSSNTPSISSYQLRHHPKPQTNTRAAG